MYSPIAKNPRRPPGALLAANLPFAAAACSRSHTVSTATLSFNRNKVLESPDATVTTAQLTILTATQERRQVMLQITGSGAKRNLMQVVSDKQ
jgi:hypothetical protein